MEAKLLSYPKVAGLVFGNWGEASEAVHSLVEQLAVSRAKIAEPQKRNKGGTLTEEGVKSLAVGTIRRRLSIAAVKAQSLSLLGRLEVMGSGSTSLVERRRKAVQQEEKLRRSREAHRVAARQGFNVLRKGFPKLH